MPGHRVIGRLATFDSSKVMRPLKPGSMNPAVEWVSRPSRPRLELCVGCSANRRARQRAVGRVTPMRIADAAFMSARQTTHSKDTGPGSRPDGISRRPHICTDFGFVGRADRYLPAGARTVAEPVAQDVRVDRQLRRWVSHGLGEWHLMPILRAGSQGVGDLGSREYASGANAALSQVLGDGQPLVGRISHDR